MINDLKITIGQLEIRTGDIIGNTDRIIKAIETAISEKSDILVLPEAAITGYCCGSLFNNIDFIKDNINSLTKISSIVPSNLDVVLGFIDLKLVRLDGFPEISNTVGVLNNGKVIYTYDKQCMANSNHHEDKKYFTPGTRTSVVELTIRGTKIKVGTPICEDVWYMDHVRNIPYEMKHMGAEILLVCNQSFFTYDKMNTRVNLYKSLNKELNIPIVQCNAIGIGDIVKNFIIYDGGSMIIDKGNICSLPQFKDTITTFILSDIKNNTEQFEKYPQLWDSLVYSCKEIFKNCGVSKAQVHLSGGLDSSIVACIVKESMGLDNCVFISNPTSCNGSETKGYAQILADKLGIKLYWNEMQSTYDSLYESFVKAFGTDPNPLVKSTFQAVGRTVQGLSACNHFKSAIVCTGNHTENILGWCNFSDIGSKGMVSLVGDLTKVEIYQFSKWINEVFYKNEVIPVNLYNGKFKPAAELPDSSEDPFDYWVVSGICSSIIRNRMSRKQIIEGFITETLSVDDFPNDFNGLSVYCRIKIDDFVKEVDRCFRLMKRSVFKSAQHAPNIILSKRTRGFSDRETLINHYTY